MFCLLCNELQIDSSITLTSQEAKQQRISSLLWKHFRFCFDDEPTDGDLCRNCWQKLASFHEFYMRIESVHEQINRIASSTLIIKEENIEEDDEQITQLYGSESSFKYEPMSFEDSTSETAITGDNIKEGDNNNEDETNDDFECNTPIEAIEAAKYAANEVLPSTSKKYQDTYRVFKDWQTLRKATSISQAVLVSYFHELAQKKKPTSLWAYYSMLKTTIKINHNIDIGAYHEVTAFIKSKSNGYTPAKASIFTGQEIQKFIDEAPDDDWLDVKVVSIFAISGPCRTAELPQIKFEDIENHGESLLVRIVKTKTKVVRAFTITGEFYTIVQKYIALRPAHMKDNRFFVNYHRGKCTKQVIGINKFNRMPRRIATYLQLPKPECYTGHSFRRTSATIFANTGASMETIKGLGSLRSSVAAEEYIDDTFTIKIEQVTSLHCQ